MGAQRVSRHNGRSGKSGAYSSKHNDRQFDADKTEHINTERMLHNVYWDYQNGLRTHAEQESGSYPTFAEIEKQFYTEQYSDFLTGQHERNRKAGHSNRDRSVEDLLRDKRVCPEETIYQIGKEGSETPPEVLLEVIQDYHARFNQQFGEHVHIRYEEQSRRDRTEARKNAGTNGDSASGTGKKARAVQQSKEDL